MQATRINLDDSEKINHPRALHPSELTDDAITPGTFLLTLAIVSTAAYSATAIAGLASFSTLAIIAAAATITCITTIACITATT